MSGDDSGDGGCGDGGSDGELVAAACMQYKVDSCYSPGVDMLLCVCCCMYAALCMLICVCCCMYAALCMLLYVCCFMYADLCMLLYVC